MRQTVDESRDDSIIRQRGVLLRAVLSVIVGEPICAAVRIVSWHSVVYYKWYSCADCHWCCEGRLQAWLIGRHLTVLSGKLSIVVDYYFNRLLTLLSFVLYFFVFCIVLCTVNCILIHYLTPVWALFGRNRFSQALLLSKRICLVSCCISRRLIQGLTLLVALCPWQLGTANSMQSTALSSGDPLT